MCLSIDWSWQNKKIEKKTADKGIEREELVQWFYSDSQAHQYLINTASCQEWVIINEHKT